MTWPNEEIAVPTKRLSIRLDGQGIEIVGRGPRLILVWTHTVLQVFVLGFVVYVGLDRGFWAASLFGVAVLVGTLWFFLRRVTRREKVWIAFGLLDMEAANIFRSSILAAEPVF